MTSKVRTFYICDICGAQGEMPNTAHLPEGWKEIRLFQVEFGGTGIDRGKIHACSDCVITKDNQEEQPKVIVKSIWDRLRQKLS
jgi:hypothetical protein